MCFPCCPVSMLEACTGGSRALGKGFPKKQKKKKPAVAAFWAPGEPAGVFLLLCSFSSQVCTRSLENWCSWAWITQGKPLCCTCSRMTGWASTSPRYIPVSLPGKSLLWNFGDAVWEDTLVAALPGGFEGPKISAAAWFPKLKWSRVFLSRNGQGLVWLN